MSDIKIKVHQIRFLLELSQISLHGRVCSSNPLAVFKRAYF